MRCGLSTRKDSADRGSVVEGAGHGKGCTVHLGNPLCDSESESAAFGLAPRRISAKEAIKNVGKVRGAEKP